MASQNRSLLSHRVSAGSAPSKGSRRNRPYLFQLLVAPGILWLVAASLLALSPFHMASSSPRVSPLCVSCKDTSLNRWPTWVIQDDLLLRSLTTIAKTLSLNKVTKTEAQGPVGWPPLATLYPVWLPLPPKPQAKTWYLRGQP